jgi:hypothetical protein
MIAIHTKYLCPTNSKGARIKAYTHSGFSATISYPHELSHEVCHFQAVKALVKNNKLEWDLSNMRYGDSADGRGYVFCFDDSVVGHHLSETA